MDLRVIESLSREHLLPHGVCQKSVASDETLVVVMSPVAIFPKALDDLVITQPSSVAPLVAAPNPFRLDRQSADTLSGAEPSSPPRPGCNRGQPSQRAPW